MNCIIINSCRSAWLSASSTTCWTGTYALLLVDSLVDNGSYPVAAGAIDALTLLDKYIAPGCILLFDDLVNYPGYREHEILALWEWLEATGRKLEVPLVHKPDCQAMAVHDRVYCLHCCHQAQELHHSRT